MKWLTLTVTLFATALMIEQTASFGILGLILLKKAFITGAILSNAGRRNNNGYRRSSYGRRGGNRYRFGRSIEDNEEETEQLQMQVEEAFLQASVSDVDDCGKAFVCQLNALPEDQLTTRDLEIKSLFNVQAIDVMSDKVEFDLAAVIGQRAGAERCLEVYGRCQAPFNKLRETVEQY